jgi:1-acyl-sn-glycerol-3-phosphate acyltransferase
LSYQKIIESILVKNIAEIIPLFKVLVEIIEEILAKGNILEISNHSSWFNAPFIATMLIYYCNIHPEQIFIVL